MLPRLRRFLDIRAGEGWPVFYCFLYVAIAVASFLLAKPIRNGLFLQEFGAYRLVYVYVGVPLVLAVFIPIYSSIVSRVGQRAGITGSLVFLSLNVLAFWYAFTHHPRPWLSAAFYIWVNCYGVIAPVQAWMFANAVFDTRQARRLFGLVGAGASLGAIVGGLLARELVDQLGSVVDLMLVLAAMIAAAASVVNVAWRVRRAERSKPAAPARRLALGATLGLIGRTPYLRLLAALVVLVAIATQWTQFQLSVVAEQRFGSSAAELTEFFGTFNFVMGIVAFAVQVVLTGPALRKFGIAFTILLLPCAIGTGSALILVWPVLWTVLVTNALDQGLRFSVDKSTFEVLYLPLPAHIKPAVKGTIDLVINRLADGAGGVLLGLATQGFSVVAFVLPGAGLGVRGIAALNLVVVALWLAVAWRLRRGYVDAIRDSIQQHRLDVERAAGPVLDRSAAELLAGKLAAPDPGEVLYALDQFEAQHTRAVHPAVRGLLSHGAPEVRRRAIALLARAGDRTVLPQVEVMLHDRDLDVRTEALMYLAQHSQVDPLDRIERLGDFPDFSIQAGMIAFLSRPGFTQNLDAARVLLERMVDAGGESDVRSRAEAARLLGALPRAFDDVLARLLGDDAPEVWREAVASAARLRASEVAGLVVPRLGAPGHGDAVARALVDLGDGAVPALASALADDGVDLATRSAIPPVLAAIGGRAARDGLVANLLSGEVTLRSAVIDALGHMAHRHAGTAEDRQTFEMALTAEIVGHYRSYQIAGRLGAALDHDDPVARGLRASIELEQERVFRLLELLQPGLDLGSAWYGLRSGSSAVRSNALELLDNVLSPELRALVVPLFDPLISLAERARRADRIVGTGIETNEQAVAALVASDDPWLRSCGVYAVGALRLHALADTIDSFTGSDDPLMRETVRVALMRLRLPAEADLEAGDTRAEAVPPWQDGGQIGVG